jgi:hypothetical protein
MDPNLRRRRLSAACGRKRVCPPPPTSLGPLSPSTPPSRSAKTIHITPVQYTSLIGPAYSPRMVSPRRFIDDGPSVAVSRLVAEGKIARDATRARIHLDGVTSEFSVARLDFPNGGWWMFVVCYCGKRARTLWLHEGRLSCRNCLMRRGFRYRCEGGSADKGPRLARLRARLSSLSPARLHPRPGRTLDRRRRLEAALGRAVFVERLKGLQRTASWALGRDGG